MFVSYVIPLLDALSTLLINKIGVKNAEYVEKISMPEESSSFAIGFSAPSTSEEEDYDE